MNIFYLSDNVELCAQYHVDSHVIKMILESGQLLCTAVNVHAGRQVTPYKTTHVNHPCSIWTRQNRTNAIWLYRLMHRLNEEYLYRSNRYNDHHLTIKKLEDADIFGLILKYIPDGEFTKPALAMPDEYKTISAVESYRNYYRGAKTHLHKWTKRGTPAWL